mgnify:CR=1 FL=1
MLFRSQSVQRAMAAGFDRHLVKPVPLEVVLEVVEGAEVSRGAAGP